MVTLIHASRREKRGFTLVELIVVIVVIAILATITTILYMGAQKQAKATALADGLKKTEAAMVLWQVHEKSPAWPNNNVFNDPGADGNDPRLSWMIANTSLGQYMPTLPKVSGVDSTDWLYDWDDNPYPINSCTLPNAGVNIFVSGVTPDIVQEIDNMIDDGNINCGKVRYVNYHGEDRLNYKLSADGTINS